MSGILLIAQGSPNWWNSSAIWVTSVSDPSTPVPNPIAGRDYTVWVKISNPYPEPVESNTWNLFVCWAIPEAGPIPLTAIGSGNILSGAILGGVYNGAPITVTVPAMSFVNLQAEKTWTPSFENGGHECLIAAAYLGSAIGGLPVTSLNGDAPWSQVFTIAQHNLGVLPVPMIKPVFHYPFQVYNNTDGEREFSVAARQAPLQEIAEFLAGVPWGGKVLDNPGKVEHLGIVASTHSDPEELRSAHAALSSVKVAPRSSRAFTLGGSLKKGNALVHVTQSSKGVVVGGLSVLMMSDGK
jgi:hypothetical protein